jgi:hypothetical protein
MIEIIEQLRAVMEEKNLSSTTAALFIRCSARQVDRWLKGEATPTFLYREAIKKAIKKMKKL